MNEQDPEQRLLVEVVRKSKRRPRRLQSRARKPDLEIDQILAFAEEFKRQHGRWPMRSDGPVEGQIDLTWCGVDKALKHGNRGLRPGSSLAKLLMQRLGKRHRGYLPNFTTAQILEWADAHKLRTGCWPSCDDGPISGAPGETWQAVERGLFSGRRGLPGGTTLAQLLCDERGVRNFQRLPKFTKTQILVWADAFHTRTGTWPYKTSGPVEPSSTETWSMVHEALTQGLRGMPGGSSLARFLAQHRGARNRKALPKMTVRKILAWADTYHDRTGKWPTHTSGPIPEASGETWSAVHEALYVGQRGFPGGDSLFQFLLRNSRRTARIQGRQGSRPRASRA